MFSRASSASWTSSITKAPRYFLRRHRDYGIHLTNLVKRAVTARRSLKNIFFSVDLKHGLATTKIAVDRGWRQETAEPCPSRA